MADDDKVISIFRAKGAVREDTASEYRPAHGGYPEPASKEAVKPGPSISTTAAVQVVRALRFYANSGFDHGEQARKALAGMATVLDTSPQPQP